MQVHTFMDPLVSKLGCQQILQLHGILIWTVKRGYHDICHVLYSLKVYNSYICTE